VTDALILVPRLRLEALEARVAAIEEFLGAAAAPEPEAAAQAPLTPTEQLVVGLTAFRKRKHEEAA
jgi:hypothetical protein